MANDYRSVNDDIKDEVISIPTVIGNHTFIHKMVEDILDDLNDELDDPLVEPKAVKFIKKDYHYTIRICHDGDKYIDVQMNLNVLMDFYESTADGPMHF